MDVVLRWPDGVPESEFYVQFLQGMLDRMALSYYKYGAMSLVYPDKKDALGSERDRRFKYIQTKNTEWLIDCANFYMIEFVHPSQPGAHFRSTTDEESPGRLSRETGSRDAKPNE